MRRRSFIALFAAALIAGAAAPQAAFARSATPEAASALIETVVSQVISLIKAPGTTQSKESAFRAMTDRYADMRQIAGFAVGVYAREMDPAQRDRYVEVFTRYIAKVYTQRFSEYGGETISVGRTNAKGSRGYLVESTVNASPNNVDVQWLVNEDRANELKVSDIIIEGISLAQSYRSEFTGMIAERGDNIDAFIDALEARL